MNQSETIEFVKKYLEDIVAFFDLNLDVEVRVEDGVVIAVIPSSERNSLLIGRNAETLWSIQSLLSAALRNKTDQFNRVSVDIADYRKQHADKLVEKTRAWIEGVRKTGQPEELDLNAADRWIVHNTASEYDDIETHSEGEGRNRRLIISLKSS